MPLPLPPQDLADFQRDKQARLNKVPAVLTIKAHAVQLPSGASALPEDLSSGIVISRGALERLQCRLGELASERAALKDSHRSLQRQAAQLAADKASKEGRLEELQARCKEVQLLKFGQLIDLSVLDQIGLRGGGNAELKAQVVQQVGAAWYDLVIWHALPAAALRVSTALPLWLCTPQGFSCRCCSTGDYTLQGWHGLAEVPWYPASHRHAPRLP